MIFGGTRESGSRKMHRIGKGTGTVELIISADRTAMIQMERKRRSPRKGICKYNRQERIPAALPPALLFALVSLVALGPSLGFLPKSPFGLRRADGRLISSHHLYTSDFATKNIADNLGPANATTVGLRAESTTSERNNVKKATQSRLDLKPTKKLNLKLVLIDHYDSFTYNLYDMLAQLCEQPPIVLAKDAFEDWAGVLDEFGSDIDGIILSPGPGTPTHPDDIGTLSPSAIQQNPDLPILGVCLGHQILGHVYGAEVYLCGPVHGQVRTIEQQQHTSNSTMGEDPLWKDIPSRINVTRYHSLAVRFNASDNAITGVADIPLVPTAYTLLEGNNDGSDILMGLSHTKFPHYGVQFHPESVGSDHGFQLLRNFCDICESRRRLKEANGDSRHADIDDLSMETTPTIERSNDKISLNGQTTPKVNGVDGQDIPWKQRYQVFVHKLSETDLTPLEIYEEFLSKEPFSVWLDTSRAIQSASSSESSISTPSHSSILGAGNAPVEYYGKEWAEEEQGLFQFNFDTGEKKFSQEMDILSYLDMKHEDATHNITMVSFEDGTATTTQVFDDGNALPFEFRGGHVGYLGYEVWHDSLRFLDAQEHGSFAKERPAQWEESLSSPPPDSNSGPKERVPTSAFLFLDKSWVYDHSTEDWYIVSVAGETESGSENTSEMAMQWMESVKLQMEKLGAKKSMDNQTPTPFMIQTGDKLSSVEDKEETPVKFSPNRPRSVYNQNFADCIEQIRLGESYELCLTNQLETNVSLASAKTSPLDLYKLLRERNPAPFSSFLHWNAAGSINSSIDGPARLALCCSSPERFLSVKRRRDFYEDGDTTDQQPSIRLEVEAKPIKGTSARVIPKDKAMGMTAAELEEDNRRALELQASVKNRAENLMIVDLLRNDLSRVCESGSVHVSKLMDIESYATVHQMVSTIRGTLDFSKAGPVDVLRAAFPGGSMTGAPKIRTMEILDRLEEGVSRGPYSGSLGYISLNGAMDMNIVIRSALVRPEPSNTSEDSRNSWKVSIGAGGAITALSESEDEYEEMILKASAVVKAVEDWAALSAGVSSSSLKESSSEQ